MRLPNFIVVGAMKCATTTLASQLNLQNFICMSQPKEPQFFSNDAIYKNGIEWYSRCFEKQADFYGEASTNYAKLPTYPNTISRIKEHCPEIKIIYLIRHPIERLVSQYIHEWSTKEISGKLNECIEKYKHLTDYSMYSKQISPYIHTFGKENVKILFFESFTENPQKELESIRRFLQINQPISWQSQDNHLNTSHKRIRNNFLRTFLWEHPKIKRFLKLFIADSFKEKIWDYWRITKRPIVSNKNKVFLENIFDEDLKSFQDWFGIDLNCSNFREVALSKSLEWIK